MENTGIYFRDRLILLLLSVNAFLTLLASLLVLLRLNGDHGSGYFIQYRANLGLNAYTVGSYWPILAFMVFAVFVLVFHTFVSMKVYTLRRPIAVVTLAFGTLLLVLTVIVSNALLVLR